MPPPRWAMPLTTPVRGCFARACLFACLCLLGGLFAAGAALQQHPVAQLGVPAGPLLLHGATAAAQLANLRARPSPSPCSRQRAGRRGPQLQTAQAGAHCKDGGVLCQVWRKDGCASNEILSGDCSGPLILGRHTAAWPAPARSVIALLACRSPRSRAHARARLAAPGPHAQPPCTHPPRTPCSRAGAVCAHCAHVCSLCGWRWIHALRPVRPVQRGGRGAVDRGLRG